MVKQMARLPDAELDVMLILWDATEPLKTSYILERINQKKNWSMSTLQALLSRLADRNFIGCEKQKRYHYYYPLVCEEDYRAQETKTFLERFYGNSYRSLIATLVNDDIIHEDDIDEITEIIRTAVHNHQAS